MSAEEETAERTHGPRQSRLARFLGQWTRSGRFESRSHLGIRTRGGEGEDAAELVVPRDTATRNAALVLLVAAVAFGLTFAVVKLRQRGAVTGSPAATVVPATAPSPVSAQAPTVTPAPAPAAPPAVVLPPPPGRSAAAMPAKAASGHPAPARAHQGPKGLAAPPPAGVRRAPRSTPYVAEPPQHLKGELLPLQP